MASTQADSTLVKGAYAAAGGNIKDYGLEAAQGLTKIGTDITSSIGNIVQQRRDRFELFANNELQRKAGELNDVEFDELERSLRKRKEQFAWSGKKDQGMMTREMDQQKKELDGLGDVRNDFANSGSKDGDTDETLSDEFLTSGTGVSLVEAFEGAPIPGPNGELGYEIWFPEDGGTTRFVNETQIRKLLDDNKLDVASHDALMASIDKAFKDASDPHSEFNYTQTELSTRQNIVEKGKYESLVNREMIPGRNFKEDLICAMDPECEEVPGGGLTYEQLGITEDMLNNIDETLPSIKLSDGISSDEAAILANELIKDKESTKDFLTKYYTNFIEQNFNKVKTPHSPSEMGTGPLPQSLAKASDTIFWKPGME